VIAQADDRLFDIAFFVPRRDDDREFHARSLFCSV
jgi:hypothetical protein